VTKPLLLTVLGVWLAAATCAKVGETSRDGATGYDAASGPDGCVGLQCKQVNCAAGDTTISGTAFAPNGTLPLFNVMAYVPNRSVLPFKAGIACDHCGALVSGDPVALALSDSEGKFKIKNAPAGRHIPLVLQVGKWRRQVTIPLVTPCQDTLITDAQLTRLPRNRREGDMPRIAITTGECDTLGCLLLKVGVDPGEIGVAGEGKALTFFKGSGVFPKLYGPPNMTDAETLWTSDSELEKYDQTLLSCECAEVDNKSPAAYAAMTRYLARGGRIFGSDFMYVWYRNSPDPRLAGAMTVVGGAPAGASPLLIDTSFPRGKVLADWMMFVDPGVLRYGQIPSRQVYANMTAAMPVTAQVWATSNSFQTGMPGPRIITVDTPAGVPREQQCGRAVHLDAHISPAYGTGIAPEDIVDFPISCQKELGRGEEALAFFLFDLAACIGDPIVVP
jgi:hypothetical protein